MNKLWSHHNTELVFNPSSPVIDEERFERKDWTSSEFGHIDGIKEIPANALEPRGLGFIMRSRVDTDYAANTTTRRLRTGFLVYLNCSLVYLLSKK